MRDLADLNLGGRARRLRVDTIVRLRWLAVAGQLLAILTTYFGLGFSFVF
jgi:two-component system sensor histidine kinase RegB